MSNPTSNFGWQMPTPTDLVTDLPADFEVFGQAVDTSLADLKGGTTGQILSKATNTDMDFVWITNDQGDITAVNVTSPITGGGTSGAVTVGIQSASTSQSGAVQLSDSTSTTSSVLAATPTAVKSAYDLAAAAIPKSTVTAKGSIVAASASSTPAQLAVGNNGETLVADSSTATGLSYQANWAAGKNKIINGNFGIWQRGTSFTTAGGFLADRYRYDADGSGVTRAQSQQTFTAGTAPVAGYEGQYFLRMNQSVAGTGATYNSLAQAIEDVRTFAGQTVTVSFWAKAAATTTIPTVKLNQNFGSGGSALVSTTVTSSISVSTSWTRYSYSVAVPSISGKTIGTSSYLNLVIDLPLNATFTLDFWGVQVEAGSVATAFQTATGTIQGELAACQRYYYRTSGTGSDQTTFTTFGYTYTTTNSVVNLPLPVTMRVKPTAIDYANVAHIQTNGNQSTLTALTINNGGTNVVQLIGVSGAITNTLATAVAGNAAGTPYIGLSAEL